MTLSRRPLALLLRPFSLEIAFGPADLALDENTLHRDLVEAWERREAPVRPEAATPAPPARAPVAVTVDLDVPAALLRLHPATPLSAEVAR